jgi:flagellar L-ring protein FlgH
MKTMRNCSLTLALAALSASAIAQVNSADNNGSLIPQNYKNPLVDRTAKDIGDILTVVVIENATSNMGATTSATKKDSNAVTAPFVGNLNSVPLLGHILGGLGTGLSNLGTGANSSVSGAGSSSNTSTVTAKVAVVVKQVLPNGNLVVEGTRWVKVNKQETNITFTGIVRRDDIRPDDTIASENVAEAKITNESKGLVAERQRKGFITRLLDWLF